MSSSASTRLSALTLMALALPAMEAAQKQRAAAADGTDRGLRDFLADLFSGKCGCPECTAAAQAGGESPATAGDAVSAEQQVHANGDAAETPQQEVLMEVRTSSRLSASASRAVGFTRADNGSAMKLKCTAAALISELEEQRDSLPGGSPERLTAEGHIGAIAQACSWAVARLPKQAS